MKAKEAHAVIVKISDAASERCISNVLHAIYFFIDISHLSIASFPIRLPDPCL